MNYGIKVLGLGFGCIALAFTFSGIAHAENHDDGDRHHDHDRDHHDGAGVGVHIGGSDRGHYEDRIENVLVAPARIERRLVPATFQLENRSDGTTIQVQIAPDHYEDVTLPEVYETRTTRVWVEDRASGLNLGFGFHL